MKTLALLSIVLATLAAPALAARDVNPVRGARRMILFLLAFDLAYTAYVTLVHASLVVPMRY